MLVPETKQDARVVNVFIEGHDMEESEYACISGVMSLESTIESSSIAGSGGGRPRKSSKTTAHRACTVRIGIITLSSSITPYLALWSIQIDAIWLSIEVLYRERDEVWLMPRLYMQLKCPPDHIFRRLRTIFSSLSNLRG